MRNALDVWALCVLLSIAGLATKAMSPADIAYLLIPLTLAVVTAYSTTSKHKALILTAVNDIDLAVHNIPANTPYLAPAVAVADTVMAAVSDPPDDPHPEVPDIDNATQVLPSPAQRFMAHLPSSSPAPIIAADLH